MSKKGSSEPSERPSLGIPAFSVAEKKTEVVPVKVQPSLKKAIPEPRSKWIREAIIERLKRLAEEE